MLRRSLKTPIPEFSRAADLLSAAADALLVGDLKACGVLLVEADLRQLRDFAFLLTGPISSEIHRQSAYPKFIPLPKENRARMPSAADQLKVFARDGFRCRFCQSRVIVRAAHRAFADVLPSEARLGKTNETNHYGLSTLAASLDHLLPYARGGTNDPTNLVTACGPCQFGRVHWTIEEVEIENPLNFPPVVDEWDGLMRLIPLNRGVRR